MRSDLNPTSSIFHDREWDGPGWENCWSENLRPFDETNRLRIVDDIFTADKCKVNKWFKSVEVKMIDLCWECISNCTSCIALVVGIGWTPDDEIGNTEVTSQEFADECAFSSTEIAIEKYPISCVEWKDKIFYIDLSHILIDVNSIHYSFLHTGRVYDMLLRVSIIHVYASQSHTFSLSHARESISLVPLSRTLHSCCLWVYRSRYL